MLPRLCSSWGLLLVNLCHENVDIRPGITPTELVELLNLLYSAFDEVILEWGLYKVETRPQAPSIPLCVTGYSESCAL